MKNRIAFGFAAFGFVCIELGTFLIYRPLPLIVLGVTLIVIARAGQGK